ncbi:hypothetical protein ACMU_11130 [Actibacterium mucosum KCTC 23349]|uniref:DUF1868 domain-containing protein n=1 Tax=Actibacterium mucosum KCTC 23349 TaxID=1454373 RepID=A0A037ZFI6_9RHOB|nr:DUF1868 domain-containing protein [Actibacterium mucosum]KAJ55245.1 hypothetical protein ACMU_11130 [Actibacterium mucosum KCTC 23349]
MTQPVIPVEEQIAFLTGQKDSGAAPVWVGQKFAADGQVMRFAGNTTLCHIPKGPAHDALCAAQARLRRGLPQGAYAFLPENSLHMTVMQGRNDPEREAPKWPDHLPADMPIDAVTTLYKHTLQSLDLPQQFRIQPVQIAWGNSLTVAGATAAQDAALRAARDRMADALNYRAPDHATYRFHITLSYPIRWQTQAEAEATIALSSEVNALLMQAVPEIELGAIEFCRFENMHAFENLGFLGASQPASA